MAGLRVIHPGAHSTIQDRGRFGYRHLGVPVEGPFAPAWHAVANALVANDDSAAAIEMTLYGGIYEAECPLALALAGAGMRATVERANGESDLILTPGAFMLSPGDRLTIGGCASRVRAYLAVRGGFLTETILGSRSRASPLEAGELLPANPSRTLSHRMTVQPQRESKPVRLLEGPDAAACRLEDWAEKTWRVGALCDRTGVRLEGDVPVSVESDRRSVPVMPGTVQVAGGRPIILGPSCGTMGGYPIAAVVIAADLGRIGQLRPGEPVEFVQVDLAEARHVNETSRAGLRRLCDHLRRRVED